MDRVEELSRVLERAVEEPLAAKEVDKFLRCDKSVSLVDRALGMLGHGAPVICSVMSSVLVDTLSALLQAVVWRVPALGAGEVAGGFCFRLNEGGTGSWGDPGSGTGGTVSLSRLESVVKLCEAFCCGAGSDEVTVICLVECMLKVAASVPACRFDGATSMYHRGPSHSVNESGKAFQSFLDMVVSKKEAIYDKLSPCARLHAWRLRPSLLEHDVSKVAHEAARRPLLSIQQYLTDSGAGRHLIVCLALAPDMCAEVRRHLHTWLLLSGAASILRFRSHLMEAVRKVYSEPSTWGLDADLRLLPGPNICLGSLQPCLRILRMAPCPSGLVELVRILDQQDAAASGSQLGNSERGTPVSRFLHVESFWSLQLDFLPWFKFAVQILFKRFGRHTESAVVSTRASASKYVYKLINPSSHLASEGGAAEVLELADRWIQFWSLGSKPEAESTDGSHARHVGLRTLDRDEMLQAEMKRRKKDVAEADTGHMEVLERWFADFYQAFDSRQNSEQNRMNTGTHRVDQVVASLRNPLTSAETVDVRQSSTKKPGSFPDLVLQLLISADPTILNEDMGCVPLLYVAFGTSVELDLGCLRKVGEREGIASHTSEPHSSSPLCQFWWTWSGVSCREPQHRTERFTGSWQCRFWQQAAEADIWRWIRGGDAIFHVMESDEFLPAVVMNEAPKEATLWAPVLHILFHFMEELSVRLANAKQASHLKDLRDRFWRWTVAKQKHVVVRRSSTSLLESLDQQLSRCQVD